MVWGTAAEGDAKAAYSFYTGHDVTDVGFITHPRIPSSGASPDGHVDDDGSLEVKCPNTNTHIDTLLGGEIPGKYVLQIQWQLACSGRKWADFISFDPRMPESMRLFVRRMERNDAMIADLEAKVSAFLAEVEATVTDLRTKYEPAKEAA